ncbi:hypothetical protein Nepgr_016082 [Nepenthes gracilis]|uniref:Jacalin-type lectin domain-containing protein n=1 Tax=Nepenthes gracilis TaxID=150966 RepID=A0AAD3SPU2_NEPGR|nr:hypothetical protein Nepgr_016082 [Nepenthes gracilis]
MEVEKDQQNGKMTIAVGPCGGHGGESWDDGCHNGVRELTLVYGRCIDSISIVYDDDGKPVKAEKHGGSGGSETAEIKLNYPEEYLIGISGHYGPVVRGGNPVIRSLTFKTNQRTFGPFGALEGVPFSLPMDGGRVVGFIGRCCWFLDAIGFHLSPKEAMTITKRIQLWLKRSLEPKNTK